MKLLIDNADIRKIEEAYSIFPLEGVTTNPTILAAAGATAGLILEAFFSVEGLLRTGEEEFGAALAAGKGFVGIHASHVPPLIMSKPMCFKLVPWFHTSVT